MSPLFSSPSSALSLDTSARSYDIKVPWSDISPDFPSADIISISVRTVAASTALTGSTNDLYSSLTLFTKSVRSDPVDQPLECVEITVVKTPGIVYYFVTQSQCTHLGGSQAYDKGTTQGTQTAREKKRERERVKACSMTCYLKTKTEDPTQVHSGS